MQDIKPRIKLRIAVTKKELSQRSLGIAFPVLISTLNGILFLVALLILFGIVNDMRQSLYSSYRVFLYIYAVMAFCVFLAIMLIAPMFSGAEIAGEREAKTLDLLLSTLLTPLDIVVEKMFSVFSSLACITLSLFPALCLPLIFGGVNFLDIFILFISFLPGIFLMLSAGLFASSLSTTSVMGISIGYAFCLGLLFIPIVVPLLVRNLVLSGENSLSLLLILDPLYTVISVLGSQIGEKDLSMQIMQFLNFDAGVAFVDFSVLISVLVQVLLGLGLLLMTVINIMPGGHAQRTGKAL